MGHDVWLPLSLPEAQQPILELNFRLLVDIGLLHALTMTFLTPAFGVLGHLFLGESLSPSAFMEVTQSAWHGARRGLAVAAKTTSHLAPRPIRSAGYGSSESDSYQAR